MTRGDGKIPIEKKRMEISSQRQRAVSCGLELSASYEKGNELSVGFIFYIKISQVLKNTSVRWNQLVKAICCATLQAFSVVNRRNTV